MRQTFELYQVFHIEVFTWALLNSKLEEIIIAFCLINLGLNKEAF